MQRVLFIQTAFIGDAILGTAAVRALHDQGFQVDVLVRKGNEIFYKGQPNVNQVWVWDKKKKWKSWWTLLKGVRRVKYDKIYLAQRFFYHGVVQFTFWCVRKDWIQSRLVVTIL
jgi:heptosyltransferase-2